jgi:hypothetical protein
MPHAHRTVAALLVAAAAACTENAPIAAVPAAADAAAAHAATSRSRTDGTPPDFKRQLAALREATAPFVDFDRAVDAGYGTPITVCWEHRALGAMGYHYGNPELIDGTVDLLEPEVLMYEPGPDGEKRLVGMEYIVPIEAWTGETPPMLLGQEFHPHASLPIYKLHIWLWHANPRGFFVDWNPRVSCRFAEETEFFD